ncbi:MAG: radical SAM protein [Gammaproteobacteria bacterium]|nr:radical SAM protein [Gammaproteobacteria bacterium]
MSALLNLGAWQARSVVNGPGERFVLWVQGCPWHCRGCINPEFLPARPAKHHLRAAELAAKILAIQGIEGVTYSGGEPFLQAAALAELSEPLHTAGLGVVCFSGYTVEALREKNDAATNRLLQQTDLLIDGMFEQDQAAPLRWRGSRNQRLHFLTARYARYAHEADRPVHEVELSLSRDTMTASGFWPEGFVERLKSILEN